MVDILIILSGISLVIGSLTLIIWFIYTRWHMNLEKRKRLIEVIDKILANMKKYLDEGLLNDDPTQIIWGLQLFTRHWKRHKDSSDSKRVKPELKVEEYYNLLLEFKSKLPKDENDNPSIPSQEELTLEQRKLLKKIREDGKKLSEKIDKIMDVKKIG